MSNLRRVARWVGVLASGILLAGCTSEVVVREQPVYAPPPPPPAQVEVVTPAPPPPAPAPVLVEPGPPPAIVITRVDDFYEPLGAYGRWADVPGVGHCWIPTQAPPDWRPYTAGHWEETDAGWYWVSDEPWGWATCHYGRWDFNANFGWYWAPDVVWGPAWVSWRNGGGYVGWAPLPPAAVFHPDEGIRFDVNVIPARSYCFVPEAHFTEPVRPTTIIVNNTTIINKTVNITRITVVNKTVINEGPPARRIEQATGRAVPMVKAAEVRQRVETRVAVKPKPIEQRERPVANEQHRKPEQERPVVAQPRPEEKAPVTREEHPEQKPVVTREEKPVEKPRPVPHPEQTQVKQKPKPAPAPQERNIETRPVEHPGTPAPFSTPSENLRERNDQQRFQTEGKPTPGTQAPTEKPKPKAPVRKPGETNAPAEHREPQPRPPGQ